ncbi:MAG: hypothetical protein E6K81_16285 [Candidatus Eisenbacteria bacterium]|uniref:TRASH domain-containing protein n=1 Tax=Eiseniibacteriota bacterium TaxID=2212470 RepID=A0A538TYZ3_UNCEI|nr:MAG: hypothetical protein E6K81_16285 [Candidatus Eisenbacteria bacterium]
MMNRIVVVAVVALVAIGAYGVFGGAWCPSHPSADPARNAAARGAATGAFDPMMSGACRFSCSVQQPFDAKDVVAQPGAVAGRLTRCPVSGVVFQVDDQRPRVALATGTYVVCCDRCAVKLRKDPGRFVRG